MRNTLSAGLALLWLSSAAVAESYVCTMTNKGMGGWVGDRIILSLDREQQVGAALDWAIAKVHQTAIPVDVTQRKPHLWRFKWAVEGVPTSNDGSTNVSYSALLNTNRKRVTI